MQWNILIKDCGPELRHVKGKHNTVASVLGQLGLKKEEFSLDTFSTCSPSVDVCPFDPNEDDF